MHERGDVQSLLILHLKKQVYSFIRFLIPFAEGIYEMFYNKQMLQLCRRYLGDLKETGMTTNYVVYSPVPVVCSFLQKHCQYLHPQHRR